jgi:transcription-repair coupling factor (superfamily II helicase)
MRVALKDLEIRGAGNLLGANNLAILQMWALIYICAWWEKRSMITKLEPLEPKQKIVIAKLNCQLMLDLSEEYVPGKDCDLISIVGWQMLDQVRCSCD